MDKIKLWKNNKLDQIYEITREEMQAKYKRFLMERPTEWVIHYYDLTMWNFIGANDGLQSVNDPEDLQTIAGWLKPILREFIKTNKKD